MPASRASWFWEMSSRSSNSQTATGLSHTRGAEELVFTLPVSLDAGPAGRVRRGFTPMPWYAAFRQVQGLQPALFVGTGAGA